MKIHGTTKGGALSHKDLGVAFGGGGGAYGDQITILQNDQLGYIESSASWEGNGFQIKLDDMIDAQLDSVSMWLKTKTGTGSGTITCSAFNADGSEIGDLGTYDLSGLGSTSYVKVTFDDESQVIPEDAIIMIHDMSGLSPAIRINGLFEGSTPSPTPPAAPFQFYALRASSIGSSVTMLATGGAGDYARTEMIYRKPV
jgi:hypothetical protein